MALEAAIEATLEVLLPLFTQEEITQPKHEQVQIIASIFEGRDSTLCVPTGFGKSLCFFAVPAVYNLITGQCDHKLKKTDNPVVVVVSPLISLMESHVKEAKSMGLRAIQLPADGRLSAGDVDIIFGSPEYLTSSEGMEILKRLSEDIILLATDEVHVVPKWGSVGRKKTEKAFRIAFSKIRNLRSIVCDTPILALTATATSATIKLFQRQLGMRNVFKIVHTPDKRNIHMSVSRVTDMTFLTPIIEELKEQGKSCKRTIIYCLTTKDCVRIYQEFDKNVGDQGYIPGTQHKAKNRLFCMYFSDTIEATKKDIVRDLLDDGHYRVTIATNALGLGINIKDCSTIYHYGVPRSIEDYIQEIGRAGRSGEKAKAVMFYRPIHVVGCSEEMKEFIKSEHTCRRTLLFKNFDTQVDTSVGTSGDNLHECCDICTSLCQCGTAHTNENISRTAQPTPVRQVEDEDVELLTETMEILKGKVKHCTHQFGAPIFSDNLIDMTVEHVKYIDSIEYIALHLPIIDPQLAVEVFRVICEVFDEDFHIQQKEFVDTFDEDDHMDIILANLDFTHMIESEDYIDIIDEDNEYDSDV